MMTEERDTAKEQEGQAKRLYKSRRHKIIGGVCGGIAEYFGIDPTLVRIAWVVLTLVGGLGMALVYIVGMIVIPKSPYPVEAREQRPPLRGRYVLGIVILGAGLLFLLGTFNVLAWAIWPPWSVGWGIIWGVLLIVLGTLLIRSRQRAGQVIEDTRAGGKRFIRVRTDRVVGGVCGGLARHFGVDPSFVRLAWALGTVASAGIGILAYIVMWILLPEEPAEEPVQEP